MDKSQIEALIEDGALDEAIFNLDAKIAQEPQCSLWWYLRGKAYWRLQLLHKALTDYEEASRLDPSSPATHALQLTHDILNFYNPDLLNP